MRSARCTVAKRWAMMIVVFCASSLRARSGTRRSLSASSALVRFIEKKDRCVAQDGARDRYALALTAGEGDAAFAEEGVVALREPVDEFGRLRGDWRRRGFRLRWRPGGRSARSQTQLSPKITVSCGTSARRARASRGSAVLMSTPSIRMRPDCGSKKRCRSWKTVVLPAPRGPRCATVSPGLIVEREILQRRDAWAHRVFEGHVVETHGAAPVFGSATGFAGASICGLVASSSIRRSPRLPPQHFAPRWRGRRAPRPTSRRRG